MRERARHGAAQLVGETAVWLEINGTPAVTWMCTADRLEELAVGWLFGEGYIGSAVEVGLKPCATDLGFWATVPDARVASVAAQDRRAVLASGCGAVATYLAPPEPGSWEALRGEPPGVEILRARFRELFALGERYKDTGGIHAAALTDGLRLMHHAEDIGRHNAVDKVVGAALLGGTPLAGLGLLVTGRISAELASKAAAASLAWVATPSVPSTLAATIAGQRGMILVGRAVSGQPQLHRPEAAVRKAGP